MTSLCYLNIGYSEESNKRNLKADCDSTCMINAGQASTNSNFQQRVVACIPGFSGTKLQTRVRSADNQWSEWKDKDVDNCTCSPTTKTQTTVCEEPLKGTKTEKSTWTCTSTKSGVWSDWITESGSCYTPCVPEAPQNRGAACPYGYTGDIVERRTSTCGTDESKPPVWSSWQTVVNTCKQQVCLKTEYVSYQQTGNKQKLKNLFIPINM